MSERHSLRLTFHVIDAGDAERQATAACESYFGVRRYRYSLDSEGSVMVAGSSQPVRYSVEMYAEESA